MSSFLGGSGSLVAQIWSGYVLLGTLVLLAVGWGVVRRLAARNRPSDSRAGAKAAAALAFSLLLGVGGFAALASFEASSETGIHQTFVKALNQTVGEGDYLDNHKTAQSKPKAIGILEGKLENATAALQSAPSPANRDARDQLWKALNDTRKDLATAVLNVNLLTPNHQVWLQVYPLLAAGTDAKDEQAHAILLDVLDPATVTKHLPADVACKRDPDTGLCILNNGQPTPAAIQHSYRDLHTLSDVPVSDGVPEAFAHKQGFRTQMQDMMGWFVYPGVTGLFLAPFAFAGGSILNSAHEPSATVGFKPYPGKAAGLFLLLGAFGVLAIPFAAWVLRDLSKRSKEGQISL
jgi:hypothetical protein